MLQGKVKVQTRDKEAFGNMLPPPDKTFREETIKTVSPDELRKLFDYIDEDGSGASK